MRAAGSDLFFCPGISVSTESTVKTVRVWRPARLQAWHFAPLAALPAGAHLLAPQSSLLMMAAFFLGAKLLTLFPLPAPRLGALLGYLFLWPGMDPEAFFHPRRFARAASLQDWAVALGKTAFGAALLIGAGTALDGWVGLIGLCFLLFFGLFHLSALAWRMDPIFRSPFLARSVGELWCSRWNMAFHQLAFALVYRPLKRAGGARLAVVAVFALSGALHDAVLSVPAGGGYGLPTLYFLIQAAGVLLRVRGRVATAAVALLPVPLLFHGAWLDRVLLPWLEF